MKLSKESIDPKVFDLYDQYVHNRVSRKDFIQKLSLYAVGGLTVPTLMSFLMPNYADTLQISEDDPRITSKDISYDSPKGGGQISGLWCLPKDLNNNVGAVVVVHENRGLYPYVRDVVRRVAVAGFIALAPVALSPLGGYPGNDDEGRTMQAKRDRFEMLEDFIAAADFLRQQDLCNGKVGVVGFCFGGWVSNIMAARVSNLNAAVPFYGGQAPLEEVSSINAPLQLHYAEEDPRVNAGWAAYEQAL